MVAYIYDMKKTKKIIIILCVMVGLLFCACAINVKTIIDKTSDLMSVFFFADANWGEVEVYCGQREKQFEYDGVSTSKVDYGIIKICFDEKLEQSTIDISFQVNEKKTNLTLEKNPFDQSYMIDIEKQISSNSVVKINILNSVYEEIIVDCQSKNWQITDKEALEIAGESLQQFMIENSKNNLDYECYLKVVHNVQDGKRLYFYTFSIKTNQHKNSGVVIDVNTGEVLAKS